MFSIPTFLAIQWSKKCLQSRRQTVKQIYYARVATMSFITGSVMLKQLK